MAVPRDIHSWTEKHVNFVCQARGSLFENLREVGIHRIVLANFNLRTALAHFFKEAFAVATISEPESIRR